MLLLSIPLYNPRDSPRLNHFSRNAIQYIITMSPPHPMPVIVQASFQSIAYLRYLQHDFHTISSYTSIWYIINMKQAAKKRITPKGDSLIVRGIKADKRG